MTESDLFSGLYTSEITERYAPENRVTVIHGDTEQEIKNLPQSAFSLIITSPPYNIGKVYEKASTLETYLEWQERIIAGIVPLLKPGASLCWQVGNYVDDGEVFPLDVYFYPLFKRYGLNLRNRVVWHFDHGLHASRRFSGRYETLLWFTNGSNYTFNLDAVRVPSKYPGKLHFKGDKKGMPSGNPLGKNPSDFWQMLIDEWETGIWEIPNVKANHCEKTEHPCQFPVELAERCILAFTNPDDLVLDPFAGVGSALIAATRHGRRAVGIDKSAKYCSITKERLAAELAGTLKTRPLGKPVHKPTGKEKLAQVPLEWLEQEKSNK